MFVSLTRLRIRSVRFLPFFALHAYRSLKQVKIAPGFRQGLLLVDKKRTFWTMTAWDTEENMRGYMTAGSHKAAMAHLLNWCDEASVAHWMHSEEALPSWLQADHHMRTIGRASKVRHPSPQHAGLGYAAPRTSASTPITRP